MKKILIFFAAAIMLGYTLNCNGQSIRLFAGRYTEKNEKGMFVFDFNQTSGAVKLVSDADGGPSPSYFCISKKRNMVYAANEVMDYKGNKEGGLTALKYDPAKGILGKIKDMQVPYGGPCFISLSPAEDYVLMANYSSSSVTVVKLDAQGIPLAVIDSILFPVDEGKISHPHMIAFDPSGKRVYLTDLGFDRLVIYNFDNATGKLKQLENGIVKFTTGAGPRHFVFNTAGTKLYVICELNSTISVFDVDQKGMLKQLQTLSTLSGDFKDESFCADIHIGNSGEYLYGSNRGENTIVVFRIGTDGKLTLTGRTSCGGNWPRNFIIEPSGKFILVANQKSGDISVFKIDKKTGLPVAISQGYIISGPSCLKF